MSPAWRGFAGLFTVVFLAFYVTNLENKTESEQAMVSSTDPIEEASNAYEQSNFVFYEVWLSRRDKDGHEVGYWVLHGEKDISPEILKSNPDRYQFSYSKHFGLTDEQNLFTRRARKWSQSYNIHLAKLIGQR